MNDAQTPPSTEEAEYDFQQLRAQRLRAKLLFLCYLDGNGGEEYADEDDYYDYYADETCR